MSRKFFPGSKGLPFSAAVRHGNTLEVSGQIGLDNTNQLVEGIEEQTRQAIRNLGSILKDAGLALGAVVKTRVYITDMDQYRAMNTAYAEFFGENPPARVALGVNELPFGALVEIECTATYER